MIYCVSKHNIMMQAALVNGPGEDECEEQRQEGGGAPERAEEAAEGDGGHRPLRSSHVSDEVPWSAGKPTSDRAFTSIEKVPSISNKEL
jgi:hypothetical protein